MSANRSAQLCHRSGAANENASPRTSQPSASAATSVRGRFLAENTLMTCEHHLLCHCNYSRHYPFAQVYAFLPLHFICALRKVHNLVQRRECTILHDTMVPQCQKLSAGPHTSSAPAEALLTTGLSGAALREQPSTPAAPRKCATRSTAPKFICAADSGELTRTCQLCQAGGACQHQCPGMTFRCLAGSR